ncbi:barwin-like endoglucanase [Fomitiporia mediterranea MF3/22]|uniref:barwin-like endoglucanase n=1 Tax=Fomitiporia mediterranea (strain MF3/22) TaxID=694068 RepID=UPI0004408E3C|nr:barwin-like endoglucanase [Fomitiporia mediterranea MF3/22]EJD03838.1 barwin-like endoglucanase [Fomitiporia mediterranea MF3/22]
MSGVQHGDGTFFDVGLGSCGITSSSTEMVAAISKQVYDGYPGATGNPNNNPICGKEVKATYQGKSVTVKIVDRCDGCTGPTDLDFSRGAFDQLADEGAGRIQIEWQWA